jgi:hypothetical protein
MTKRATLLYHDEYATLIKDGEGYVLNVYESHGTSSLRISHDGEIRGIGEPASKSDIAIAQGYLEDELAKGRVGKLHMKGR